MDRLNATVDSVQVLMKMLKVTGVAMHRNAPLRANRESSCRKRHREELGKQKLRLDVCSLVRFPGRQERFDELGMLAA